MADLTIVAGPMIASNVVYIDSPKPYASDYLRKMSYAAIVICCTMYLFFFGSCSSQPKPAVKFTAQQIQSLQLDSTKLLTIISDSVEKIDLDPYIKNQYIFLNELINEMKVIILETNRHSLVSDIRNIIVTDSMIYIFDKYEGGGIIMFNNKGKFVKRLERGPAPAELLKVTNMDYDHSTNELMVYHSPYLSFFNATSGEFLRRIRLPLNAAEVIGIPGGYIFQTMNGVDNRHIYGHSPYQILITDKEFRLKSQGVPYIYSKSNSWGPKKPHYNNGQIYIVPSFSDTIYQYIDDYHLSAKYVLNYSKRVPEEVLRKASSEVFVDYLRNHEVYIFMGDYAFNSTHAYFYLLRLGQGSVLIYRDMKTGKCVSGTVWSYDMSLLPSMSEITATFSSGDYFVTYAYPDEKSTAFLTDAFLPKETVDEIKKLKEDDNPMIILYKIKSID